MYSNSGMKRSVGGIGCLIERELKYLFSSGEFSPGIDERQSSMARRLGSTGSAGK